MKPFALLIVSAALTAGGLSLHTRYEKDHALRVEVEMSMSMDTETKMERDGQPVEGRGGMGSMSSESEYKEVHVDQIVEADGGKAAKVKRHFEDHAKTCLDLCAREKPLPLPAYEHCMHASHCFNLLDARGAISVTERAQYIGRVRELAKTCAETWMKSLSTGTPS